MPKSLLGSLVIAPIELPPQALPPSMRRAALAAKDLMENPTPKTARLLAEARLGTVVHPFDGPAFRVNRVASVDGQITFSGKTGQGLVVAHTVDPLIGFMPRWAAKLASAVRVAAFDINGMIQEALQQHGLPVDTTYPWNRVLATIFLRAGVPAPQVDEAIQEAVYRAFYLRDALGSFDPSRLEGEDLAAKVRSYVIQLMTWQAKGNNEAGDKARSDLHGPSLDDTQGEEGLSTIGDTIANEDDTAFATKAPEELTPESFALRQSDIRSLTEFRELFSDYVHTYRSPKIAQSVMLLFDLIVTSHDGAEVGNRWADSTGTSYSNLRKTLGLLREAMLRFAETKRAPGNQLSKIIREIKQRATNIPTVTPEMVEDAGPKAPSKDEDEAFAQSTINAPAATNPAGDEDEEFTQSMKASSLRILSADAFMAKLASTVMELRRQAATVVDQSMLYIRMSAGKDPRYMELTFYSPSLRMGPGGGSYRIEVGDWSTDQGLNERKVREGLSTFVVPQLRGDVLDEDHALLEKVIRKLKDIVWENAVAYFEVPLEQKPSWRNTVKLDIQTLLDHKVTLVDKNKAVTVARSNKAWAGRKAHRMVAAGPNKTAVYPGGLMDNDLFRKEEQDRADRAASWNMQPGGFINRNDWYSDVWAEVITAHPSEPGSPRGPFVTYYRYEKDGTPNRQFRGKDSTFGMYLRAYSPTLPPNARLVATKDGLIRDGRKVVPPAKQARSLGGEQNLTPAEQEDFAPMPDKTASSFPDESKLPKGHMVAMVPSGSWSGGMPMFVYKAVEPRNNRPYFLVQGFGPYTQMGTWLTEEQAQPYLAVDPTYKQGADANDFRPDDPDPAPSAKTVGAKGFDPEMHDPEAEPSITFMAEHLKANGVPDTAENMQEAIAGFTEARDAHHKESSMSNPKFAALKRVAAENPDGIIEAVKAIADKMQGMVDNLKVMVENLQGGDDTHVEGDAVPAEPIPGQEGVTAGIQRIAEEAPDQMEEALNEFYQGMDEVMALTENLADNLDIPLSANPVEEEGTEVETEEPAQTEDEPVKVGE